MPSLRPRPELESLKICPHGGLDYAELKAMRLAPEGIIDFSVCSNPYPPPPTVRKSVSRVSINRYPDSEATEFRECLAPKLGVAPDNILAGNGTTELIRLIALTYFRAGDTVLIFQPTYGEYEIACQIVGAGIIEQRGRAEANFSLRVEETIGLIQRHRPRGIFICNPNNPTGQYLSRTEIDTLLGSCGESLLILDEAYVNFVDGSWSSLDLIGRGNVIILRSMTKDYALAGLRLGYAVASEEIIGTLRRVCPPWNVNAIALRAGAVALGADGFVEESQKRIRRSQDFLAKALERIGLPPLPSRANFFLVRVGDGKAFRQALLRQGILVRDCASLGLPEYVRISPRTIAECRKLIVAIRSLKQKGGLDAGV